MMSSYFPIKFGVLFLLICIAIIGGSYFFTPAFPVNYNELLNNFVLLSLNDAVFIFFYNFISSIVLLIASFTGLPILAVIDFLINIGHSGRSSGIPAQFYYSSSITHLLLELYIFYNIMLVSVQSIRFLMNKRIHNSDFIKFMKATIRKKIPRFSLVLLLASLLEVFVSNRMCLYIVHALTTSS